MTDDERICDVIKRLKEIEKIISEQSIVSVPIDVWAGMTVTIEETIQFLEVQRKCVNMWKNEVETPCENCQEFNCDFCKYKECRVVT